MATPSTPVRAALALVAVGVLAAGCGGGSSDDGRAAEPAVERAEEGAFPVTIEHMFGETEIAEEPQRVVTVGFTDQDAVLAHDVVPVGVREWYDEQPGATFPWAEDALDGELPEIIGDGSSINYEAVAAQRPDLILGMWAGLEEDEYDRLSQIAPTVVQSGDYPLYAQPWQETTRMVGAALGQPERSEELVGEVEDAFAAAREEHPELEGATAAMAQFGDSSGMYYLLHPADPKASFLTNLGLDIPDEIADVIEGENNTELSFEHLDLVDQDVVVWFAGVEDPELVAELRDNPVYQQLDVAQEGRDLFLEDGIDALAWSTVLSLPEAIEIVTPQVAEALAGGEGSGGA